MRRRRSRPWVASTTASTRRATRRCSTCWLRPRLAPPSRHLAALHEHLLDALEVVAALRRRLGVAQAVGETGRDELESDLLHGLGGRRDLGDDVGALALLGEHRLDAAHLTLAAAPPLLEVVDRLLGKVHLSLRSCGSRWGARREGKKV